MNRREATPHGSEARYQRHVRAREIACPACLVAHREYERARYRARKAVAA